MDEALNLNRKRRLLRISFGSQVGNLTNDSAVTRLDGDTLTLTSRARGTEEAGVLGLHDEVLGRSLRVHEDIDRLAGQRSVVDLHFLGFENDSVGRNVLTDTNDDDVTGDHHSGLDLASLAVSDDIGNWRNKVLELRHHLSGLGSLHVRENTGSESNNG